ncbi:RidA family protein [Algicella marina]|uniref:RidA family protein n=1 Tax=Algicella marina TaxID=2683284 RepID=A0A6P1SYC4_9RHOB|nr:RidA family protein [Algicella marina]QHQ34535.1 RidA family protein [Algicella marina]
MPQPIIRLNPAGLPDASQIGYSQISITAPGRTAYISGQVAIPADGGPVPGDLASQMEIVGANAHTALTAIGASVADIAMVRLYVVDLTPDRLEAAMPAFLAAFNGVQPSLTGIGVSALAAPDYQVEMEMIVHMPD